MFPGRSPSKKTIMHSNAKKAIRARLDQLPDHVLWEKDFIRSLPHMAPGRAIPYVGFARNWLRIIYTIKDCTLRPEFPKRLVRDVVEGAKSHAHWNRRIKKYPDLHGNGNWSGHTTHLPECLQEYATLHQAVVASDDGLNFAPDEHIEKTWRQLVARLKASGYELDPKQAAQFKSARDRAKEIRHNDLGRLYVIPFLFRRPLSEVEVRVLVAIEFEHTRKPKKGLRVGRMVRRFGGRSGHGYKLFGHSQTWIEKCGLFRRDNEEDEITVDERVAISQFLKAVARLERDFQIRLVAKKGDGALLDLAGVKKMVASTRGRKCDSGHKSLTSLAKLVVWFEAPKDYLKIWREVFYQDRGLGFGEQQKEESQVQGNPITSLNNLD